MKEYLGFIFRTDETHNPLREEYKYIEYFMVVLIFLHLLGLR